MKVLHFALLVLCLTLTKKAGRVNVVILRAGFGKYKASMRAEFGPDFDYFPGLVGKPTSKQEINHST
jgi:hypothetical protein